MTGQERDEIIEGKLGIVLDDNEGNSIVYKTIFYNKVIPYINVVLMKPKHSKIEGYSDVVVIKFNYKCKGFLEEDAWGMEVETDPLILKQLIDLYEKQSEAKRIGKITYSKVFLKEEADKYRTPNFDIKLSVYACYPDGTIDCVNYNKVYNVGLDGEIYNFSTNDDNNWLCFQLAIDTENFVYLVETSIEVANAVANKLMRTHVVGNDSNLATLLNDDIIYKIKLYKDGELLSYERLYDFKYQNQIYFYFRVEGTNKRQPFGIENVLGEWRIYRIDDTKTKHEIFWNHPFCWPVPDEKKLLSGERCSFSRHIEDKRQTFYTIGNVAHSGSLYFILSNDELLEKNQALVFRLRHPRGEAWLYNTCEKDLIEQVLNKFNKKL